ncbi:Hsp70 family protein [Nocardia sp. NBC_00403]|uniref:Hsp70 family protein n=1 Tax=Nocardia sp. NBC_00403 TaxID=2975990 RepID=UPI002E1F8024
MGLGLSIGSVNSVAAVTADESGTPAVAGLRTTMNLSTGAEPDVGCIPRSPDVIADFADLITSPDPVAIVDGRVITGADLVAVVANRLALEADGAAADAVLAYPAIYLADQVAALRQALDRVGLSAMRLVPEPLAAVAWLDTTAESELVLVYDLGASSLDLAVVRIESGTARLLGRPLRSYDFGGRPFDASLARHLHDLAPAATPPRAGVVPGTELADLYARHVQESVTSVLDCVRAANLAMSDIDRVLLIGGAAQPTRVARVLADELGRPVVRGPEPAQTIALGAAVLAACKGNQDKSPVAVPLPRRKTGLLLSMSPTSVRYRRRRLIRWQRIRVIRPIRRQRHQPSRAIRTRLRSKVRQPRLGRRRPASRPPNPHRVRIPVHRLPIWTRWPPAPLGCCRPAR